MPYTASDAFCVQADVEGKSQRGPYTTTTFPTQQQVIDAMAMRGAQVEGVLKRYGVTYTVTSRGTPFPTVGTNAEADRLRLLCLQANAIGAAMDAVQMQDAAARSTDSELIKALGELFAAAMEALEEYCATVSQPASSAATSAVNRATPVTFPTVTPSDSPMGYGTEW